MKEQGRDAGYIRMLEMVWTCAWERCWIYQDAGDDLDMCRGEMLGVSGCWRWFGHVKRRDAGYIRMLEMVWTCAEERCWVYQDAGDSLGMCRGEPLFSLFFPSSNPLFCPFLHMFSFPFFLIPSHYQTLKSTTLMTQFNESY